MELQDVIDLAKSLVGIALAQTPRLVLNYIVEPVSSWYSCNDTTRISSACRGIWTVSAMAFCSILFGES